MLPKERIFQSATAAKSFSHRWSWVWADVTAFPPGQVQAPDEFQVERMAAVQHGEAQDVGLIIHHFI